jgi:hypothetical protein
MHPSSPVEPIPDAADSEAGLPCLFGSKTHHVVAALVDVGKICGDLTGRLPHLSRSDNQYVLLVYDYDGNIISTEAMKSRTDKETIRAYSKFHQQLIDASFKPELQIMDNECPLERSNSIPEVKTLSYSAPPPDLHR